MSPWKISYWWAPNGVVMRETLRLRRHAPEMVGVSELVGIKVDPAAPMASNALSWASWSSDPDHPVVGAIASTRSGSNSCSATDADELAGCLRLAERRTRTRVARWGAGLPAWDQGFARRRTARSPHGVEIHGDAGQPSAQERRAAYGRAVRWLPTSSQGPPGWRQADQQHRPVIFPRPPPHDPDALGHGPGNGLGWDRRRRRGNPRGDHRLRCRRSAGRRRACRRSPGPSAHITGSCNRGTITVVTTRPGRSRPSGRPAASGLSVGRRSAHPSTAMRTDRRRRSASTSAASRRPGPVPSPAVSSRRARNDWYRRPRPTGAGPVPGGGSHFAGSLCARTGPPPGGGWSRLPRTLPRVVRIAQHPGAQQPEVGVTAA